MMDGAVILKGPVPATGVLPLVQAVGIGRQTSIVELHDGASLVGQLSVRSGKVFSIDFGGATGLEALERFVSHSGGTFLVRSTPALPLSAPMGDLRTLLQDLGRQHDRVSLLRGLPASAPSVSGTGIQTAPEAVSRAAVAAPPAPQTEEPRLASVPPPAPVAAPAPAPVASPSPAPVASPSPAAEPAPAARVSPPAEPARPQALPASAIVVAVASAKGGVGKTTLTLNLAVALARRGLQVIVVDGDPNGSVSAAVNAHKRIVKGAFDVICGAASVSDVLLETRMEGLRVLPAGGAALSFEHVERAQGHTLAWRTLLTTLAKKADIVLLDTAGGVYGPTRTLLSCATHVLGVLQAEPLAMRTSAHFERAIASLDTAPKFLGVAMNMFDSRGSTSPAVLQEACDSLPPGLLFDTSVPRTPIVNDATLKGIIAGQGDLATAPAVAWTFEQLSAELLDRLEWKPSQPALDEAPLF